jgi:hypothetical protein
VGVRIRSKSVKKKKKKEKKAKRWSKMIWKNNHRPVGWRTREVSKTWKIQKS